MVGVVLTQLSSAQAATEVARFPANNTFLTANSNDPVTPQSASLLVDINTLTLDMLQGELPENGLIDVQWEGTGVQRQSGSTFFEGENVRGIFVGTSVTNDADITGSVFGTPLVEPFGDIRILHSAVIVITRG
jgi:hypothetical protein